MARKRLPEGRIVDGYRQVWDAAQKKYVRAHRKVWEEAYGPIPDGYEIHHKDNNRLNNALDNLECLTRVEHMRLEAGYEKREDVWYKPCVACGEMKPLTDEHWYFQKKTGYPLYPRCKPCHCDYTMRQRRERAEPPSRRGERNDKAQRPENQKPALDTSFRHFRGRFPLESSRNSTHMTTLLQMTFEQALMLDKAAKATGMSVNDYILSKVLAPEQDKHEF
jgi:hypothetical protein